MTDILRQAGAIPFRRQPDGLRVLLITSRDTGRWVIPKGGVEPGQTPAQAAAQEAYEEAGVKGVMHPSPIGIYTYGKRLRASLVKPATVEVYPLEVEEQLTRWPEHDQRRSEWMTVPRAAERVDEPGLRALLLRLAEIHDPQSVGG